MRVRELFIDSLRAQGPLGRARADLASFVDASLAMVNEAQLQGPSARTGLCLYVWGAARTLAGHHRLARDARRHLVREALQGMAQSYPAPCPDRECAGRPPRRAAMAEGAAVAGQWLMGDNNAPLRCAQLLAEWRAGRE